MDRRLAAFGAFCVLACVPASPSPDAPFTLYRGSERDSMFRGHWATFDAGGEAGLRNRRNCEATAQLLNEHSRGRAAGRDMHCWCERDRYVSHY
jgi:hypothetical protein